MQQAGFRVEEQVMDWGTLLARRGRREMHLTGAAAFDPGQLGKRGLNRHLQQFLGLPVQQPLSRVGGVDELVVAGHPIDVHLSHDPVHLQRIAPVL